MRAEDDQLFYGSLHVVSQSEMAEKLEKKTKKSAMLAAIG
jgi:hypothetical protein